MDVRGQVGGNSRFNLPDDHGQALEFVLATLDRLSNTRRQHSEMITEIKQDAADDLKVAKKAIGLTVRLRKMTPEKRIAWVEEMSSGAKMFGVNVEFTDEDPAEDERLTAYLDKIGRLESDRKEIASEIREVRQSAKEMGLDLRAIGLLQNLRRLNADSENGGTDAEDFFHNLDSYGAKLGLW